MGLPGSVRIVVIGTVLAISDSGIQGGMRLRRDRRRESGFPVIDHHLIEIILVGLGYLQKTDADTDACILRIDPAQVGPGDSPGDLDNVVVRRQNRYLQTFFEGYRLIAANGNPFGGDVDGFAIDDPMIGLDRYGPSDLYPGTFPPLFKTCQISTSGFRNTDRPGHRSHLTRRRRRYLGNGKYWELL